MQIRHAIWLSEFLRYTARHLVMESPSQITVDITLQPGDLYDPFAYSWQNTIRWVSALFVCYLIYETRSLWASAQSDSDTASALLALSVLMGFVILLLFLFPYLRVRSIFKSSPAARKSRHLSFSVEGIHLESEDARGDYKWTLFNRTVETPRVFMFLQTRYAATYVPKRCFSKPEDIVILRQLIRDNFRGKLRLRRD